MNVFRQWGVWGERGADDGCWVGTCCGFACCGGESAKAAGGVGHALLGWNILDSNLTTGALLG